ncbi:hypothetical protein E4U32_004448 [Claviceps aff. humidiphila group G2b]|nr:hypothetical protein E4U32_004448 [Claviceps aff. humidiphila group G2b]
MLTSDAEDYCAFILSKEPRPFRRHSHQFHDAEEPRIVIIENSGKTRMERLDILIYSTSSCIAVSSPKSTDDTEIFGQPLNAIMNVPDGEFAIYMQSLTFEGKVGKVGYIRQALRIEEGMPNASHQCVTAATPDTQKL